MSTPGPIPQNAADKSNHRVAFEREREVRFAVVMYGGVSLAIYINGIAQELLNLVRATAPKARRSNKALLSEKELTGASKVYRKLGQYLSIEDPKARLEKLTKSEVTDAPITTQFVVDVISGTSAGGINGMFLAKALAQGQTMATADLRDSFMGRNDLRQTEHALLDPNFKPNARLAYDDELNAFRQLIQGIDVPWPNLKNILNLTNGERRKKADELCAAEAVDFRSATEHFKKILELSRPNITKRILTPIEGDASHALQGLLAARLCLLYYNKNFISYDMVMYPVEYGTDSGETVEVEIFRVSPEDAPSLMDEKPGDKKSSKLAGRTLMSFGAFLDDSWRRNDMLWGRLDGAERLITALLPLAEKIEPSEHETPEEAARSEEIDKQHADRLAVVRAAHLGILTEEIEQGNADAVCRLLSHALAHTPTAEPCGRELFGFVNDVLAQNKARLNATHVTTLTSPQSMNRELQPHRALEYISRSTNITGNMLSGLSDKYQFETGERISGWVARVGTILWYLIAVAVPQSLTSLFFRHWLGLFYFVAFALIIFGVAFNNDVKFAGWQLLGIVISVHLVITTLSACIRGRHFMKLVGAIIAFLFVALMVAGMFYLTNLVRGKTLDQTTELLLAAGVAFGIVVLAGIAVAVRFVMHHLGIISGAIQEMVARSRTRASADSRAK